MKQRQVMLKIRDGMGLGLGGCWLGYLDQPKWEREKLQPLAPEQGQILWPCYEVGQRHHWEREQGAFSS